MADTVQYFASLKGDAQRKAIIAELIKSMKALGITNQFTQAGILSVVSKESDFTARAEISYAGTPVWRIRQVFGYLVAKYTDTQLAALANNTEAFYNVVYGNQGGNSWTEGYKYRGRGFNGLTFKNAYRTIGNQIGFDLVSNPDLVSTNIEVATKVLVQYFKNVFSGQPQRLEQLYRAKNINDFKNVDDATNAIYHANAGFNYSPAFINNDITGGKAKANARAATFLDIVQQKADIVIDVVKANPKTTGAGFFFGISAIIAAIVLINRKKKNENK